MAIKGKKAATAKTKIVSKKQQQVQQNKKVLIEALERSLGVVTLACKAVRLDRTTFYRYVNEDAEFAQAVKDIEDVALDFVETKFHNQIRKGDTTACIFYLKTKGKHRGYIERQELTGKDGGPIETVATKIRVILPKAPETDETGEEDAA